MSFNNCFDVVTTVTDKATKQFRSFLKEDVNKKRILENYCLMIDSVATEFDDIDVIYDAKVDKEKKDILISLTCAIFETGETLSQFYTVAEGAKKIVFKVNDKGDQVKITFIFDGIWIVIDDRKT